MTPWHDTRPALRHVTVAIPVRDEAKRLHRLLQALAGAAQACDLPVTALVLANNCMDASERIARSFRSPALQVSVHSVIFPVSTASAGRARRVAMDLAARTGGLLMTTDADAIPAQGWIRAALDAMGDGADLVCGSISADVPHVLATPSGARITRAEEAYSALLRRVRHRLDQVAGRQSAQSQTPHYMESGASMAIRADLYRAIGGLPALDFGEDRALVFRAEAHGLAVRYSCDMTARVSGRLQGRADGGMAACLRHRMQDADPLADQAMILPDALRAMWDEAMSGSIRAYPDRSVPAGPTLRASDLEARLADLAALVDGTVDPDFARWSDRHAAMVVG